MLHKLTWIGKEGVHTAPRQKVIIKEPPTVCDWLKYHVLLN